MPEARESLVVAGHLQSYSDASVRNPTTSRRPSPSVGPRHGRAINCWVTRTPYECHITMFSLCSKRLSVSFDKPPGSLKVRNALQSHVLVRTFFLRKLAKLTLPSRSACPSGKIFLIKVSRNSISCGWPTTQLSKPWITCSVPPRAGSDGVVVIYFLPIA